MTRVLLALAGVTAAAVVLALVLSGCEPAWWRSIDPADPALARVGQAVENDLTTELSRVRDPAPWRMSLDTSAANAWLNSRLAPWAQHEAGVTSWPAEITQVQADFADDRVALAFQLDLGGATRIIAAEVRPRIDESGALWIPARSLTVGRLPVPTSWVLRLLDERVTSQPAVRTVARALTGEAPLSPRAELKLPDGRRVRVLNLEARDGRLIVTCRTGDGR